MIATRCPDHDALANYLLGKLPTDEIDCISDHIDTCVDCESTALNLERIADQLISQLRQPLQEVEFSGDEQLLKVLSRVHTMQSIVTPEAGESNDRSPLLPPGSRLGAYHVLGELGRGGMGSVFKARHTQLEKIIALKVLTHERTMNPQAVARFRREMKAVGKLEHPNLVCAYDAGEENGMYYLVMQFVDGMDFSRLVKRFGPLPIPEACELVRQAASGLEHAHRQGIIHRDVKPSNIMLASDGTVKVLDLGLARWVDQPKEDEFTDSNCLIGTLDYIAPEQVNDSRRVEVRTDIYSLGATLFKLLSGKAPFSAPQYDTPIKKMFALSQVSAPSIRDLRPEVHPKLSAILDRMLSKKPDERFATASDVVNVLESFAEGNDLPKLFEHAKAIEEPNGLPEKGLNCIMNKIDSSDVGAKTIRAGSSAPADKKRSIPRVIPAAAVLLTIVAIIAVLAGSFGQKDSDVKSPISKKNTSMTRTESTRAATDNNRNVENAKKSVENSDSEDTAVQSKKSEVYPTAILSFLERGSGVKGYGSKVNDILFASLAANPDLYLVDRADLQKTIEEQELNLSGAVKSAEAVQVGQLTGAKILITGSVIEVDKNIYLVAKVIGTETSRVVGASVKGKTSDDLSTLVEQLAEKVETIIRKQSGKLVAKKLKKKDRLAALKKKLGKFEGKPILWIKIIERHVGQQTIDPAAETELTLFALEAGFEVIDHTEGSRKQADIIIEGEAFSEFATRRGNLISVKARVEIKATDRTSGKIVAIGRQTEVVVDLAEQVAGKSALQNAGAAIAERLLPKLLKK